MNGMKPSGAETSASASPQEYMKRGWLREINLSRLTSGLPYQRVVDERKVNALVRQWDNLLMEPVVVSYRDGKYYLIDGQHRIAALRRIFKDADTSVLCIVHTGLTYADEAELFYRLDQGREKLSSAERIHALLQSGANPELNDINGRINEKGFHWATDSGAYGDNRIKATRAVIEAYRMLGPEGFSRMLDLLRKTWRGMSDSLCAIMLSGMALLLKTYKEQLNDDSFSSRMSKEDPAALVRKAKGDFSTNRNALRGARVLMLHYNKGVRKNGRLNPNILC